MPCTGILTHTVHTDYTGALSVSRAIWRNCVVFIGGEDPDVYQEPEKKPHCPIW